MTMVSTTQIAMATKLCLHATNPAHKNHLFLDPCWFHFYQRVPAKQLRHENDNSRKTQVMTSQK